MPFYRRAPVLFLYPLALLAVFLTALTPQGFMPGQSSDGFSIKLCSGHTDTSLAITPDHPDYALLSLVYGGPVEQDAPEAANPVCIFAAATGAALLASAPTIALRDQVAAPHEPETQRRFAIRHRIDLPPSTGPPVTV
ncbi:hypothetical protein AB1K62_05595 [Parasphingorhabdus sp. JC815]|uniref:hypothetical protein n=1 Tax=Parasphingorhabdus sp. JC815 TaxID=3232140 RepID=UPI00345A384A